MMARKCQESGYAIALIFVFILLVTTADAEELRPPALFNAVCTSCHGPGATGNKRLDAPQLAGQSAWYVKRQLENYIEGRRGLNPNHKPGRQMALISAVINTPEKIDDLASYLESLVPEVKEQSVFGNPERGKDLYVACAACHGTRGEGIEQLGGPRLRNLDDWYLVDQLRQFRTGSRGSHSEDTLGNQMRAAAQLLADDADIRDVVTYIALLPN